HRAHHRTGPRTPRHRGPGGLRAGHRAVLGAPRRPHRRPRHHHPSGAAVAAVAPPGDLAGDLDPPLGRGAHRRHHAGTRSRRTGRPERPYRHREGNAVGDAHRIGIVGLGVISRAYLGTLAGHPDVEVAAVADLDAARAADLDPPLGRGAHRRHHAGTRSRRTGRPERPYRHREGNAVGDAHRIGIVGLGVISRAYLGTLAGHPDVEVAAVADLDAARAA